MTETASLVQPDLRPTTSRLEFADHLDHFLARWSVNRNGHRVEPGLYSLGHPTPDSPVFVSANYTLSFDALRSVLGGIDSYILVLDTQGVNVWCAAGKGTFGTDELVRRIEATRLPEIVRHRVLILPQLGAPGVSAHEVKIRSGFRVEYGPVRAADLPEYLKTHQATPEMRRVSFNLRDRLVLIPVRTGRRPAAAADRGAVGFERRGSRAVAILAGTVLFPILLPWIPTHDFSAKGFILGGLVALPFAAFAFLNQPESVWWLRTAWALVYLLIIPSITAFLTLNFTGSTTFTSRSGVKREIFTYIPPMAWMFGIGLVLNVSLLFVQ